MDVLPGVKADKEIPALPAAITAYGGKDEDQHTEQTNASGEVEDLEAQVKELAALRHEVQLAANQAWPWRTPKVATIRKAFLLPTDRPLAKG